jgi:hypothetical protein
MVGYQAMVLNKKLFIEKDGFEGKCSTKKWYPVYTQPRAEKKAYQALINKGIEAYLPLHRQLKQWSDRKKWVEEPFPKIVHIC